MKNLPCLVVLALCWLLSSCAHSDDPNPNNGNNNGNNNGGSVTITSVGPDTYYADDEITINGTGFSSDTSKIKVEVGTISGTTFYAFTSSFDADASFKILSGTSTKIVAKARDTNVIDLNIFYDATYGVRVTSNGKSTFAPFKHGRRLVHFSLSYTDAINQVTGCFLYAQPGDSIEMEGAGFYGNCSVSFNGTFVSPVKQYNDDHNKLYFRIPKSIFGYLNDACVEDMINVKVTNEDGKFLEKQVHMAKSPPMRVFDAAFDKPSYTGADGNANLTIVGWCFYSTAILRISSANGYTSESSLGASGYQNSIVVPYTLGALNAGTYNVQIKESQDASYGFPIASFHLSK